MVKLADVSRPLAAPQPDYVDPLRWLCETRERYDDEARGDALVRTVLLLVACVAPSDFNRFPGLGITRAIELVMKSVDELAAALAAAPGDERGTVLHAFISARESAFVDAVHAEQTRYGKATPLLKDAVVAGMLRALIVFTRSLCVDVGEGVERPLTGAAEQTDGEIDITGRVCLDPEKARALALGRRVRADDGSHPEAAIMPAAERVVVAGMCEPLRLTYDMLDASLRCIFELPDAYPRAAQLFKIRQECSGAKLAGSDHCGCDEALLQVRQRNVAAWLVGRQCD
jgi:hypothetical protein